MQRFLRGHDGSRRNIGSEQAGLQSHFGSATGRAIQPPAAIINALIQKTGNRPNADAMVPNNAGPHTRMRLLTDCRKPKVSPDRPSAEWLKTSIVVIGKPHPMPNPKVNDTTASPMVPLKTGTRKNPIAAR